MRTYGINFTDKQGNEHSIMQDAPNKQELIIVLHEMYEIDKINWIDHYAKVGK